MRTKARTDIGMLIDDIEIRERFPERAEEIIAALDADNATAKYGPIFNGKRFRPAVEKKLAEIAAQ